jgi:hypothetical protein
MVGEGGMKYLFQNATRRFRFALGNPSYALRAVHTGVPNPSATGV